MNLNIAIRLRDLDTHGSITLETRNLCEKMTGIKHRIMLGITVTSHVTNESLYQLTSQEPLRETISEQRLN